MGDLRGLFGHRSVSIFGWPDFWPWPLSRCFVRIVFALCAVLICASCSSSHVDNIPLSVSDFAVPDNTSLVHNGEQRVAPLDMLEIKVFGSTGLDGNYQVDPSGQIKLPLIGAVPAKGTRRLIWRRRSKRNSAVPAESTSHGSHLRDERTAVHGRWGHRQAGHVSGRGPMTLLQVWPCPAGLETTQTSAGSWYSGHRRKAAGCSV